MGWCYLLASITSDVDYAAAALLRHYRHGQPGGPHITKQLQIIGFQPSLVGHFKERAKPRRSSIIDQYIYPLPTVLDYPKSSSHFIFARKISGNRKYVSGSTGTDFLGDV